MLNERQKKLCKELSTEENMRISKGIAKTMGRSLKGPAASVVLAYIHIGMTMLEDFSEFSPDRTEVEDIAAVWIDSFQKWINKEADIRIIEKNRTGVRNLFVPKIFEGGNESA